MNETSLRNICTDFIKKFLRLALTWIHFDHPIILRLLAEVFNEEAKFYTTRRLSAEYSGYNYVPGVGR